VAATPGRTRVAVRIGPDVWLEEVERLRAGSLARVAAERERARLENEGVELGQLRACKDEAEDRTRLEGLFKVYVPIRDAPPSERPFAYFAFVLSPARHGRSVYLRVATARCAPPSGSTCARCSRRRSSSSTGMHS
jgi:hypothetical protein